MDIFVDGLTINDIDFTLSCYSWGGVKFLRELNVDPPVLRNTSSYTDGMYGPPSASYLIFPPEPGHYSNQRRTSRNYNLHGAPVTISPGYNLRTGSADDNTQFTNSYALNVVGPVHTTDKYCIQEKAGITGKFTMYDVIAGGNKTCTFSGGLLISAV